ncbi:MAG TPA: amino acid permease, partial [Pyrinomonadaceae bacterium]|nr:amino acid permease [Pyrinomonadaceae bacterium]
LPFAMAEQGELPSALAQTHRRFKTPYIAIILTAAATLVLTIQSSFFTAVTIATVTRLLVYAATCLALPVFRYRKQDVPEAKFTAPAGTVVSILSIIIIVWLLTDKKVINEGLPILIAAGLGIVIYLAYRFLGNNRKASES